MAEYGLSLLEQIENIVRNEGQNTFWRKRSVLVRIITITCCLMIIIFISYNITTAKRDSSSVTDSRKNNPDNISSEIYVDLSGAVNKPGVYKLEPNTRLFMLIDRAGGLNIDADREFVARNYNLSVPLSDQQKIYIPTIYDVQKELITENQKIVSTELDQITNTSTIAYKNDLANERQAMSTVSINNDDLGALMGLPGIGEVTAQRIIASRPYGTIESLVEKGVIKQSLFEKIKYQISP